MGDIRKYFGAPIKDKEPEKPKEESPKRKRLNKVSSKQETKKPKIEKNTSKFFPKGQSPKASPDYASSATEIIPSDEEYSRPKSPPIKTKKISPKREPKPKDKIDYKPKKPAPSKKKPKSEPKSIPSSSTPLQGQTFVITGVLSNYDRNELTDILKSFGAKVTGNVSKRTSCLIHGDKLEDGRNFTEGNKYKTALENGTKIMNEEELEHMIEDLKGNEKSSPVDQDSFNAVQVSQKPARVPIKVSQTDATQSLSNASQLWVDKYKPKTIQDILGNNKTVEKLWEWLRDWEEVVIHGNKKDVEAFSRGRLDLTLNVNAKAALISGPPGVGKTTAARVVGKTLDYQIMEMNASDFRSKKLILDPLKASSGNQSMTGNGTIMKNLIVMDEVDGMSAGDRGGTTALIEVIKTTKVPIICICNDRQSTKLKSLANYCYDLRFQKPNKSQISKRLLAIMASEGLSIEPNALEMIIESSGNDIRQTLTLLEMWARTNNSMNYNQAKKGLQFISKDSITMVGNFDAAAKLLNNHETRAMSHKQKIDLFFVDFDLIPLLIQENYLSAIPQNSQTIENMANAADSIAFGDLINKQIRTNNDWTLLPQLGQASAIEPGALTGNGIPFPRFPEWFGKSSTQKKNERLVQELRSAMAGHITGDNITILSEYVPLIYKMIMKPIIKHDMDGVEEAVEIIHTYGLNPDMFKDHLIQLQFDSEKSEEEFKKIPTKTKAQITRVYNTVFKSSLKKVKKKREEKEEKDQVDPEFAEDENGNEEEEDEKEEESDIEVKPTVKTVKKKKK
ncbi:unnamed protein product [Blepharisma stoltei]|uniref:Replication factor C subunit 1 n=1 Tax=Blepharisma stoltei TaxID=1481888 RepID=A0AAU9JXK5_9CILI|nr:unnamed protein product [Blepharisma stoltei]